MRKHANSYSVRLQPILGSSSFFFDPDEVYLPTTEISFLHYHDQWEIGRCYRGRAIFLMNGAAELVQAGDAILISPGISHYSRSLEEECTCRFVYINPAEAAELLGLQADSPLREIEAANLSAVLRAEKHPSLNAMVTRMVDDCSKSDVGRMLAVLRFYELICAAGQMGPQADSVPVHDPVLSPAVRYLVANYAESFCAEKLAALCHLSSSQFRRRFQAAYGESPRAFLHSLRCQIGYTLMRYDGLTVAETAARLGYSDVSAFYRQFRMRYGQAPSAWKRQP